jgi:hypothetical protein
MTDEEDASAPEHVARGLVKTWLAVRILPLVVGLTRLLLWLAAFASYAGVIAWRVRRMVRRGALDDDRSPSSEQPSVVARERGIFVWVRGADPIRPTDPPAA